jgi:hypothetical protein
MTASTAADLLPEPRSVPGPIELERGTAQRIDAALLRIAGFADLPPDWDSYGGDPPSEVARSEAVRWVGVVADLFGSRAGAEVVPYSVAPLADGGVQLEWRGRKGIVELEVGPEGELAYLFLANGETETSAEEADDASWSDVLRRLLRAFA